MPVIERHVRMREDALVKDKTYQQRPVGRQVKAWLDAKRWEGASENTLDSYETMGAQLADYFKHLDGIEHLPAGADGIGLLQHFLNSTWGECLGSTRRQRHSALSSFYEWATETGLVAENLTRKVRRPKASKADRHAHARKALVQLVLGQETVRDRCCIALYVRLGLRKDELRRLQVRDINLETNTVKVQGKGGKVRTLPIGTLPSLRRDVAFHISTEDRQPSEYLLYPRKDRTRPMDRSSVHRWFKRCLDAAGLSDFPLHELRHSAAHDLYTVTGDIVLASMLLGHESVATTQTYLHTNIDDLARGLEHAEAAWRETLAEVAPEEVMRS